MAWSGAASGLLAAALCDLAHILAAPERLSVSPPTCGGHDMNAIYYEEKIRQFRRREIERTRQAGLSAYVLNEDGSVLHIAPDGKKELIVVQGGRRQVTPVECVGAGR